MTDYQINLLLELNPDATIRDLQEFLKKDIEQEWFDAKQRKIKEKAKEINSKLRA